jgi:murein L,D-transpeptidase YcbB/YkuD
VDGNWNQETWAAIVEFQRANGLKPDGVIDATTWSILSSWGISDLPFLEKELERARL